MEKTPHRINRNKQRIDFKFPDTIRKIDNEIDAK
jgi:hypothetical protein